jgi:hypothetical protein
MSMHELESAVELFVKIIASSDLTTIKKRTLIHKAFEFRDHGDCGFTNLRTIDKMVACKYSFLFKKEQMYDYNERKDFYDTFNNNDEMEDGDVYIYWDGENYDKETLCVDSNTKAWEGMVGNGLITGEGAEKVLDMDFIDALKEISLVLKQGFQKELLEIVSSEEPNKIQDIASGKQFEELSNEQIEGISKIVKPETLEILIELKNEFAFAMDGLYLCAIVAGIDEEIEERDFIKIFGVDKETFENM